MTGALTRNQGGQMPVDASQTEMILAQIESLPTLPSVAMRLLELTSDASSSAREVVRLVESDPSIAGRILSLVGRAHLGTNVSTVERAVVLLGFDAVRCLVLSMQVFEAFSGQANRVAGRLDLAGLWKHSLAVGCSARLLAQEMIRAAGATASATKGQPQTKRPQPLKPEEAFLCGLLHDIGKVALHVCFPKSYDRVVRAAEASRGSIADQERQVLGVDHTIAGRRLAMHWKLPAMIGESIWLHHQSPASTPTRIDFPLYVQLVQIADRLARQMHIGYSGNYILESPAEVAEASGLSPESVEQVMAALPELIEERSELIGLDRLTSRELYQGALVQANAELGRVSARLSIQQRRIEQRSRSLDAVELLTVQVGDDPTHESIVESAAQGLRRLYPDSGVAAFALCRSRGLTVICAPRDDDDRRSESRSCRGEWASAVARWGGGWVSASLVPAEIMDRLRAALGETPNWCWAIRYRKDWVGLFAVSGEPDIEPDAENGIDLLARMTGRWLGTAEARVQAQQLHEELAGINTRFVSAQAEVARMRSLAMVGEMAAGAAHELNNPLAVISGRAQLLNREGASDEVRKNAGLISEHAHRASQIVTELMEFAKPATPAPDVLDLAALLAQTRETWIARGPLMESQFELRVSDDVPGVWADEAQIRILFDELIRNAIEAMAGVAEPRLVVNCDSHPTDEKVVIGIRDNGRGMSAEVLERAATPFYSSRPAGRGRGLGLSRAVRYAEINGGRIRLSSRPGEGAEAVIELPRAAS